MIKALPAQEALERVREKVMREERITGEEALGLYGVNDLAALGELAETVNRRKNHNVVFFNINHHLNPTNLCVGTCDFCAFAAHPGDSHGYKFTHEQCLEKVGRAYDNGITEVHIVGGLEPKADFEWYVELVAKLHAAYPDLHLKTFTAEEIDYFTKRTKQSVEWVLGRLMDAGMGSMPGGGAEIFHREVREAVCPAKCSAERWLEIHGIAHSLGLKTNSTMLFGHVEQLWHRIDHMLRLRELQDQTGGFNAFIPLAFQPENTKIDGAKWTSGYDGLKTLAIARLTLDNFQHIKAYWIMLGQSVAQISLHFGANDMDGTVGEEKIARMAGGRTAGKMKVDEIRELIRQAGKIPVQRDTLYRPLEDAVPTASAAQ